MSLISTYQKNRIEEQIDVEELKDRILFGNTFAAPLLPRTKRQTPRNAKARTYFK